MDEAAPFFETVLRPYRSLNKFGFRLVMTVLIVANVLFAILMIALGGWPVIGFLGLDVVRAHVAFRLSFAQAAAFERIAIAGDDLIITRVDQRGRTREWRFPSY